jgi:hypothetical protein
MLTNGAEKSRMPVALQDTTRLSRYQFNIAVILKTNSVHDPASFRRGAKHPDWFFFCTMSYGSSLTSSELSTNCFNISRSSGCS